MPLFWHQFLHQWYWLYNKDTCHMGSYIIPFDIKGCIICHYFDSSSLPPLITVAHIKLSFPSPHLIYSWPVLSVRGDTHPYWYLIGWIQVTDIYTQQYSNMTYCSYISSSWISQVQLGNYNFTIFWYGFSSLTGLSMCHHKLSWVSTAQ